VARQRDDRYGCEFEGQAVSSKQEAILAGFGAHRRESTCHVSWEGGAGERVQGARAAYGTCFICADRTLPPVIPGFFRLPTPFLNRHI
jgi:hypothetical protein